MNTFEYLTALVSIVIGLALADMASSLHKLLRARRRVRWDWMAPAGAALVFLAVFQVWWRWYAQGGYLGDTVGQMLPYFLMLILLFLLASASLPDEVPEAGLDLRAWFEANRSYYWALFTAFLFAWIVRAVILGAAETGEPVRQLVLGTWYNWVHVAVFGVMIFERRRWIHGAVILISLFYLLMVWWTLRLS